MKLKNVSTFLRLLALLVLLVALGFQLLAYQNQREAARLRQQTLEVQRQLRRTN